MPRISVIIPVYNNGAYLRRAIDSVMEQTFRDFEILVINDGSTDDTLAAANRCATEHPGRIYVFNQPNRGPGGARNAGLREAKGEYIAFLDADDRWLNTMLEKQTALLDRDHGTGLVYTNLFFTDSCGRTVPHGDRHRSPLPRGNVSLEFFNRYFMYTSSVMLRRACAERVGWFREDLRISEDLDYFLRVSAVFRVECLDEKLLAKMSRSDSLSSIDQLGNARNTLRVLSDFVRNDPAYFQQHRKVISASLAKYHLWIGRTLLERGERSEAVPHLMRAFRHDPGIRTVKGLLLTAFPRLLVRFLRQRVRGQGTEPLTRGEA